MSKEIKEKNMHMTHFTNETKIFTCNFIDDLYFKEKYENFHGKVKSFNGKIQNSDRKKQNSQVYNKNNNILNVFLQLGQQIIYLTR